MSERYELMLEWLRSVLPGQTLAITPASSDASFRRYFRVYHGDESHIVMDAPPDREDCQPFITIARALRQLGLQAPEVVETNLNQGFLLLTDLGSRLYLAALSESTVEKLYGDALEALARLQQGGDPLTDLLPPYDTALLHQEMELFRTWFLDRHLSLNLTDHEHQILDRSFALLCASALEQPKVWVHRDYHSRNLMVTEHANPGVLDFQDAVIGPITYDLVSLLRDCYIAWPRERIEAWVLRYYARLRCSGLQGLEDSAAFLRWFDWMGVQRHLKAIGIFARLNHRDGKPGYLGDIPRTLGYVMEVSGRYPELAGLCAFLTEKQILASGRLL